MEMTLKLMLDRLKPFEVIVQGLDRREEIGRGKFGMIYKVTVNGRVCAANIPYLAVYKISSLGFDRRTIRIATQFLEECCHASKLKHPNIVEFIGVGLNPIAVV